MRPKSRRESDPVAFAVEQIAKVIRSGRYAPGERVIEAQFERELGLGRVPVREALRILAGDGVVELVKNRGARIPTVSREHLLEVLAVQDALIRFALEQMVAPSAANINRLLKHAHRMRACAQAGLYDGVLRALMRYREVLIAASGNEYLKRITRRHPLHHCELYLRDIAAPEQLMCAADAYERATQALLQGDGIGAYQCLCLRNLNFNVDSSHPHGVAVIHAKSAVVRM